MLGDSFGQIFDLGGIGHIGGNDQNFIALCDRFNGFLQLRGITAGDGYLGPLLRKKSGSCTARPLPAPVIKTIFPASLCMIGFP